MNQSKLKMSQKIYRHIVLMLLVIVCAQPVRANDFSDFEIRVIRPKFFLKRMRLELGSHFDAIMNQTFVYTYTLGASVGFHFTDSIGFEVNANYGFSVDKEDKSILKDNFDINTLVVREQLNFFGHLMWTPMYGKYQLSSGKLIYFDTFISAGAGIIGAEWQYDHCPNPNDVDDSFSGNVSPPPSATTENYFGYSIGIGQRYFLDKNLALRWDVKGRFFNYDAVHGACNRAALEDANVTDEKSHTTVTMGIGVSYFL